jgi:hypothetical protein
VKLALLSTERILERSAKENGCKKKYQRNQKKYVHERNKVNTEY